jgi:Fe-S cluster assembly ATP-binding protein
MPLLEIKNLFASIDETPILKGFNLSVNPGEVHVIMGPNGAGKSTLAKVLAGHPFYQVTSGEVIFLNENLLEKEPDERAHSGLFMSFQYPVEVPGVSNFQFLFQAFNSKRKALNEPLLTEEAFSELYDQKALSVKMKKEFKSRNLNEGFSGGEKKRNEILQMAVLDPVLAILDETDSGLDIDAMRSVADGVNALRTKENALILITHYQRLLDYITPDVVHVMSDGKIIRSGGKELALELEKRGYHGST